ncbi:MarR family winged helix-turn-helix transcriptional regulator [Variovorax sp. PBL-E5]|uniref:MarR family winged helix-turn-helix transcriptional regulator n=1 Tax=Variovorax sp. PBL-E5 TaxID=434014 RepID=UPI00131784D6|nr:MarR family transcriptional regulator [Variovorax sp. PBL-E5]VTU24464.1 homoprotocatechuate degradation operon regulator, HpaR [Variovorax sp. PBL-E5]
MPKTPADTLHVAIRLRAAVSELTRHLRVQATGDLPGSAKLSVLGQLYRRGPLTPTQLALHERVKLQTLTRLLAELEAEGSVARRRHDSDARQTVLSLAAAGARLLTAEVHRREASLASALDVRLSSAERAQLLAACDLIDRVADGLDTYRQPSESPSPSGRSAAASTKGDRQ